MADARQAARAIANSPLVKTAVHGGDPNWGRLMAAAGRAGVAFDPSRASIKIGPAVLYLAERAFSDQEPLAEAHLHGPEVEIEVDLGHGGQPRRDDLDLRLERRVRENQRGLPNLGRCDSRHQIGTGPLGILNPPVHVAPRAAARSRLPRHGTRVRIRRDTSCPCSIFRPTPSRPAWI